MLFVLIYKPRAGYNPDIAWRSLQMLSQWQPPEGVTIKAHYIRADGQGGVAVADATSAAAALEGVAPWSAIHEWEVSPVVDAAEGMAIFQRVHQWSETLA